MTSPQAVLRPLIDVEQQLTSVVSQPASAIGLPTITNIPTPFATLSNVLSGRPPQFPTIRAGRAGLFPPIPGFANGGAAAANGPAATPPPPSVNGLGLRGV